MYAKLENSKLIYAPKNYDTGANLILNFNKNEDLMKKYGFKEVIDNKPTYDNTVQYLTISGYIENEDSITVNYTINEIKINNEPTLEDRIIELEQVNKEQDILINTTMLATDEMYMMLEPLLAETLGERSVSKMVDMYVAMVQRGIKTIEQVPIRYREQVKKILDQLEK